MDSIKNDNFRDYKNWLDNIYSMAETYVSDDGRSRRITVDPNNIADHADFYAFTGMHLDEVIKGFRKHRANADWFLERFQEIMNNYKGHHILVADQVLYSVEVKDIKDYESFIGNLREKGVDVPRSFTWYVPKDDDPDYIKQYWIRPPVFVNL